MTIIQDGQCGLCKHFGEHVGGQTASPPPPEVIQIQKTGKAPEDLREECGHPKLEPLHLVVTPVSGCAGFESAKPN